MPSPPNARKELRLVFGSVIALAGLTTLMIVVVREWRASRLNDLRSADSTSDANATLFTQDYPSQARFREELAQLRQKGLLEAKNESAINGAVHNTAGILQMPPGLLWCLFFQESRLNHLEGLHSNTGSRGLGQFSHFGFHEINHDIDRYTPDNLFAVRAILGQDIRPIAPHRNDLAHPSSYFSIPTAVVTSAAYLNNRYHLLKRALKRQNLSYEPELLWLYSAMAYNKGSRTPLAFLNMVRRKGGTRALTRVLNEPAQFFASVGDPQLLAQTLKRIWAPSIAIAYADELGIHMKNIRDCSLKTAESEKQSPQGGAAK